MKKVGRNERITSLESVVLNLIRYASTSFKELIPFVNFINNNWRKLHSLIVLIYLLIMM